MFYFDIVNRSIDFKNFTRVTNSVVFFLLNYIVIHNVFNLLNYYLEGGYVGLGVTDDQNYRCANKPTHTLTSSTSPEKTDTIDI